MKKAIFILFAVVCSVGILSAQNGNQAVKNGPNASFESATHNFGRINASAGDASCVFKFKNTGNQPFIIQRVRTSCGCTTSKYTKEPVLPGQQGLIQVTYAASGRIGAFDKRIHVFSNVTDSIYTLAIKGEVLAK